MTGGILVGRYLRLLIFCLSPLMLLIFKKVCRSEFGEHYLLLAENLPTSRPRKPPFPPTSDYSIGRTLVTSWSDGGKKKGQNLRCRPHCPVQYLHDGSMRTQDAWIHFDCMITAGAKKAGIKWECRARMFIVSRLPPIMFLRSWYLLSDSYRIPILMC